MKSKLNELQANHTNEFTKLKDSMDMQLQQSRDSILAERRQLVLTHTHETQNLIDSYDKEINELQESRENMAEHFKGIVDNLSDKFQKLEVVKEREMNDLEMKLEEEKKNLVDQLAELTAKYKDLKVESKHKIEKAKQNSISAKDIKMAELNAKQYQPMPVIPTNNSIVGDTQSVVSSIVMELDDAVLSVSKAPENDGDDSVDNEEWRKYLSESDDDDEVTEEDGQADAISKGMQMGSEAAGDVLRTKNKEAKKLAKIETAKRKAKEAKAKEVKKQPTSVEIKGAVAVKIQKLMDEINELKKVNDSKDEVVKMMKLDMEKMKIELMYQKNRADGVDEINRNLRSTHFNSTSGDSSTTITYKRTKRNIPVVKRTPHLLMHTKEVKLV